MSQSLAKNLIHLVFSTKHRKPWIKQELRSDLFAYQASILRNWESLALTIGGYEDHVHVLFSLSKNFALKRVVEELKKGSSKWFKREDGGNNQLFYWQRGYAAFSVSQSRIADVARYIDNQPEHHRKLTFQEELRLLLKRHGIEFDERYLWD